MVSISDYKTKGCGSSPTLAQNFFGSDDANFYQNSLTSCLYLLETHLQVRSLRHVNCCRFITVSAHLCLKLIDHDMQHHAVHITQFKGSHSHTWKWHSAWKGQRCSSPPTASSSVQHATEKLTSDWLRKSSRLPYGSSWHWQHYQTLPYRGKAHWCNKQFTYSVKRCNLPM